MYGHIFSVYPIHYYSPWLFEFCQTGYTNLGWGPDKVQCDGVNILVPEYILTCIITYVGVCILSELWRYLSDDDFCGCLLPSLAWCSITPTFCDSSRLLHDICSCNNQNQRVTESWYWPAGSAAYTYHPKMSMNQSDINDKVFFCSQFLLFLEQLWRQNVKVHENLWRIRVHLPLEFGINDADFSWRYRRYGESGNESEAIYYIQYSIFMKGNMASKSRSCSYWTTNYLWCHKSCL